MATYLSFPRVKTQGNNIGRAYGTRLRHAMHVDHQCRRHDRYCCAGIHSGEKDIVNAEFIPAKRILSMRNSFRRKGRKKISIINTKPRYCSDDPYQWIFDISRKQILIIMAHTYHQMYVQTVFAVKYRAAVIEMSWKHKLFAVMGNLINETDCKSIIVNGVEDHVHCFFGLRPPVSVSDVMKNAKAKSSKWLNESGLLISRFEWQEGFGAFSYSHSDIKNVYRYIQRQEEHHKKQTFRKEYIKMLEDHEVEYDERYLFEDLK